MSDQQSWQSVDQFLIDTVVEEDSTFAAAREASHAAGLPAIEVSPNQGKFLSLICQMTGARRVLEFGTLGGYSALWFAKAVGGGGRVVTLEIEVRHAEVARANAEQAGLADRIEVIVGPAAESVQGLIDGDEPPFDVVFIDADKPSNPRYLTAALQLARPGTVIIVDNIVRRGRVLDDSDDPALQGTREVLAMLGAEPRLSATAVQTVGLKGWDGFAVAVVR